MSNTHLLYETTRMKVEHEYENAFLIDKPSQKVLFEDCFHGDPEQALIDTNNEWAIIAGDHLSIWTTHKSQIFNNHPLKWVHALRIKNMGIVEILTDPLSDASAIWELNVQTFELNRIKEFKYDKTQHDEHMEW